MSDPKKKLEDLIKATGNIIKPKEEPKPPVQKPTVEKQNEPKKEGTT